ncbi:MAG: Ig-like domain-containing protein [Gammaproteobacteria bacterium]
MKTNAQSQRPLVACDTIPVAQNHRGISFVRIHRHAVRLVVPILLTGFVSVLVGCGGNSSSPTSSLTLQSIAVTPATPSIAKGANTQFTATGVYSDHSTQDLTSQASWSSSNTAIATVSNAAGTAGLVTTTGTGTATISASLNGISGNTTLIVTAATLKSIQVTPLNPSISLGNTQSFTATGTYTDNSTQNLTTQVTWSSSSTDVATISNATGSQGLATSVKIGTATITATNGSVAGSTVLTVTSPTPGSPPSTPPAQICGDTTLLSGPATPPDGAVTVAAGDNSSFIPVANTTYWFAPGTHTFGTGQYGQIIPANNDVFIGAPGAILDGENVNLYAFTGQATNVTVEYLTIQNFGPAGANGGEGVVNHDSGTGWTIQYNTVQDSAGAGVFAGTNNAVRYNCLSDNGEYGFQVYSDTGPSNVLIDHNEIVGNNTWNWEVKNPGCGCSGGDKFWDANGVTVTNNWIHDNHGPGLWADTDDNDFDIENNYIANNDGEGIIYEISYNALIKNNTFIRNALVEGPTNPGFPTGAIYLSESGGDSRVAARYSTIEITGNQFTDNYSGVVLWENSNRFCGSPDNSSSGYCTLVNPTVANFSTCVAGTINNEPYYSDCRWKTQNVNVHNNTFSLDPANIPNCTAAVSCGLNGVFSEYGTDPSWSPYMGFVVSDAITFNQNNVFSDNTYIGPWEFMAHDQSTVLSPVAWQAAPYNQDAGSTFN